MKRKTRVIVDSFHLIQALTGIRTYTTQLCEGLENIADDDVEYMICPNWRKINETGFLRGKVNGIKKVTNHLLYFVWKQVYLPLLILLKRADLVVTTDYLLPFFKFGAKSVTVIHDTFYWDLKGKYNPIWRWYFLKSVHLGIEKQTEIIVTSDYIKEKVEALGFERSKMHVAYQAPKKLEIKHESFDFAKIGLPHKARYFLHVGIFEERKNLSVLVDAFNKLIEEDYYKDFYLLLAGSRAVGWFHDDFNNLKKQIENLNIQGRVIMPGFVDNGILGSIYKNAFAYVFPSKEEGFGIPVIEAMRSEIPVIISDQRALVEVSGGSALVFDSKKSDDLFHQMKRLSNPDLRKDLIEKGTIRSQEFTQEIFAHKFHEVVKQALKS
ncbi:glycosyltransferase family 4 protein [Roseivirga sp.]|uniref:glycosyltransferase family 4 protein n=1 Tax=Roseivirga sp. TaxID=1964215 RepID=UPI003B8B6759